MIIFVDYQPESLGRVVAVAGYQIWLSRKTYPCHLRQLRLENVSSYNNIMKKWKYTPAVRSNILSKLIFASCVWYSDRAYYGLCVLIKDIGQRLPLQLQCSYQGQQGDVSQSVRGNYKTRFWGGKNLTAVEGNASVYHVYPVSRITGEGRAEFWRTWGPDFDQKGAGLEGGGRGGGRAGSLCVPFIFSN